jgi:hypothetical protein
MKFNRLWAAVTLVSLSLPAGLAAQSSGTARFATTGNPNDAAGTRFDGKFVSGGGFTVSGTATLNSQSINLSDYIMWCIDPTRGTSPSDKNFTIYSFSQFASVGLGGDLTTPYSPTQNDMNAIASLLSTFESRTGDWGATYSPKNDDIQTGIYDNFTGGWFSGGNPPMGNTSFNSSEWYIMYNGNQQTFAFRVPETGSVLLMLTAMMGIALVARRRYA